MQLLILTTLFAAATAGRLYGVRSPAETSILENDSSSNVQDIEDYKPHSTEITDVDTPKDANDESSIEIKKNWVKCIEQALLAIVKCIGNKNPLCLITVATDLIACLKKRDEMETLPNSTDLEEHVFNPDDVVSVVDAQLPEEEPVEESKLKLE